MIGNLEPEERIMNDIPNHDWTKNEDGFFAWEDGGVMDRVQDYIETLGWDPGDEIAVEIGGTAVSGIHQAEGVNPKWSRQFGERAYNKEAFIVIKNKTRSPVVPSKPMEETNEEGSEG